MTKTSSRYQKQEILQWLAKKDKIQKLLEGFLRKVAQYDKNLCVVLGRDPKIPIYGGCNMLQEFLRKVTKMDKTYVGCSTLQEFLLKVAKMDKTYGREVCCKSFYARWQKWTKPMGV